MIKTMSRFCTSTVMWMGVTFLMILAASFLGFYIIHWAGSDWAHISSHYTIVFLICRLTLILALGYFWPEISHFIGKKRALSSDQVEHLIGKRWNLVIMLLLIELLLCENMIVNLISIAKGVV